jgi:hypothetical protein
VIEENLLAQCDNEGHESKLMQGIINHHISEKAIKKGDTK